MSYVLRNDLGTVEAVIDDNCGISKFYAIAETLSTELNVHFLNKQDKADCLDWDFHYKDKSLTLRYNVFTGVSLFPKHVKSIVQENNVVQEIAIFLERMAY